MLQSTLYRLTPRSLDTLLSAATKTRQGKSRCFSTVIHRVPTRDSFLVPASEPVYLRELILSSITSSSSSCLLTATKMMMSTTDLVAHGTSSRSTSGSTSHTIHDTTTASEARQPSEQTGGSEDSEKSKEGKKAKPRSFFATLLSWIWG
ncbi:hypothetical protein CEP53_010617 [Fusarium sp. AF-6]|nr:hypothetical protein CEP53_010617 [Fusarium sp. AF-6]